MYNTDAGMRIDVNPVQSWKAKSHISEMELGSVN